MIHKYIIHKLNKKIKHTKSIDKVGVNTMSQAAHRIEVLDKVLQLFGMRIGTYQTADMDIQGDTILGICLTVYL